MMPLQSGGCREGSPVDLLVYLSLCTHPSSVSDHTWNIALNPTPPGPSRAPFSTGLRLITMATEPLGSATHSRAFQSLLPSQRTLHAFDPQSSAHLQRDTAPYSLEDKLQQLGREGVGPGQGEGLGEPVDFHSYQWHLSNATNLDNRPPHWPHPFSCYGSVGIHEMTPVTHPQSDQSDGSTEALPLSQNDQSEGFTSWEPHSDSSQELTLTFPSGVYPSRESSAQSHYTLQCLTPQSIQGSTQPAPHPKPIYSYSILIFLALKHSQTGSLPVSEIYSFMTEHFPYFKTAPDGWKNSVRHNLSLNKCFEKVENRSGGGTGGGASRKGCFWALNPARVEKMQQELQKWRRKDPVTVRKSMARPEELDRLLCDWPERQRPGHTHFQRVHKHSFLRLPQPIRPDPTVQPTLQSHTPPLPMSQSPSSLPQSPDLFCYTSASRPQATTGYTPATGALESPLPPQTPPSYSAALLVDHCSSMSTQEQLMEGDMGTDIDTLNPSLSHLPLHGKLWEEVRDDSLAPTSPCPHTQNPSHLDSYRGERGSVSEEEDWKQGRISDLTITAPYAVTFAPLERVAGCHPGSQCTTVTLL
ncbi:hypothetical protein AGOR_G00020750 [Albula goreensis]|uniref:Fork-head domain-containing protein n=1 Tax=Albula goreensis TaxID=1534307 RepID=A0A8T3E2I3_9TELE|nr:hypothetical protein AGOR_G00020750 [Albula goreensis]